MNVNSKGTTREELEKMIAERFAQLPRPVQNAITSVDLEKRLRTLADSHKLHLDQWELLENEVMFALLGFQDVEKLEENIRTKVGVRPEIATQLAKDINAAVFEPIREELERELEHPQAKAEQVSDMEASRREMLGEKASSYELRASSTQTEPEPGREIQSANTVSPTQPTSLDAPLVVPVQSLTISPASSAVMPGTPPPPPPTQKTVRAPLSSSYSAKQPSTERKIVDGDPYREPPA